MLKEGSSCNFKMGWVKLVFKNIFMTKKIIFWGIGLILSFILVLNILYQIKPALFFSEMEKHKIYMIERGEIPLAFVDQDKKEKLNEQQLINKACNFFDEGVRAERVIKYGNFYRIMMPCCDRLEYIMDENGVINDIIGGLPPPYSVKEQLILPFIKKVIYIPNVKKNNWDKKDKDIDCENIDYDCSLS